VAGSKTLPPEMRAAVAAEVEALIASHAPKTLRQIAVVVGIPEGMLSTLRRGEGVGILTLLKLRELRKKPIDELLGLEPVKKAEDDALTARIRAAVAAELASLRETPPTEPPAPLLEKAPETRARRR
jgi:hypothetical protein